MSHFSDQALFTGHLRDVERLLRLKWKLQSSELTAVNNAAETKLILLLSCTPEVAESLTLGYLDRAIAIRRKMPHQIDDYESGTGPRTIDLVIVKLIKRLYTSDSSDADLLTSIERLSDMRTLISDSAEPAAEIYKLIKHKIRDLAITRSIPFSVSKEEDPGDLDDDANLATKKAPKGYITLEEHHHVCLLTPSEPDYLHLHTQ